MLNFGDSVKDEASQNLYFLWIHSLNDPIGRHNRWLIRKTPVYGKK